MSCPKCDDPSTRGRHIWQCARCGLVHFRADDTIEDLGRLFYDGAPAKDEQVHRLKSPVSLAMMEMRNAMEELYRDVTMAHRRITEVWQARALADVAADLAAVLESFVRLAKVGETPREIVIGRAEKTLARWARWREGAEQ